MENINPLSTKDVELEFSDSTQAINVKFDVLLEFII